MPRDSCTPYLQLGRKFSVRIGEREAIQSEIDEFDNHIIQCYTDGSHIEGKTVAGIHFKLQTLEMENQSIFLGIHATVYQAEVLAMSHAAYTMNKAEIKNKK